MDRFHALTAFARVVETGSFARAAERLGVSVSSVSRLVADLEAHPRRAAPQPHHAPAFAHRKRAGILRALRAAPRGSRGSGSRRRLGVDRAARARCGSPARRPSPRAISRRRSRRSRRAMRRSGSTSSFPSAWSTSWRKASTSPCASAPPAARTSSAPDRHHAHRLLRRALLPRPPRRAAGAGRAWRGMSALPTNIRRPATSGRSATRRAANAR
jgi:hypothetical protein